MTMPYRERWRGPPPPRPNVLLAALVCLGCAALCAFTSHKLSVMSQLRGWTPGMPERVMTLAAIRRRFDTGSGEYLLTDARRGTWKIQLTDRQLARIGYHVPVRVRCEERARECYVPDSVYVDDGNFGFDQMLRVLEALGVLASGLRIALRLRAWRRAVRAWDQLAPSPLADRAAAHRTP
jgi:hypothetical protein